MQPYSWGVLVCWSDERQRFTWLDLEVGYWPGFKSVERLITRQPIITNQQFMSKPHNNHINLREFGKLQSYKCLSIFQSMSCVCLSIMYGVLEDGCMRPHVGTRTCVLHHAPNEKLPHATCTIAAGEKLCTDTIIYVTDWSIYKIS